MKFSRFIFAASILLIGTGVPMTVEAASRYWVGATAGATAVWNDANNWASSSGGAGGAGVPGSSDDVIFDGGGSNVGGVVIDTTVSVASITATSGYTGANANDGHIDNATNDQSVTVSGNVVLDNDIVSMGNATWTVNGNFDNQNVGTFNRDSSTVVLGGSGKTLTTSTSFFFQNITVSGSYTVDAGRAISYGTNIVSGTITVNTGNRYGGRSGSSVTVQSGGLITGAGTLFMQYATTLTLDTGGTITVATVQESSGPLTIIPNGTFSPTTFQIDGSTVMHAGTYDTNISRTSGSNHTLTFTGSTFIITGNTSITQSANTLTINNSTNPNITFQGNVTFATSGGGAISYTKGNGTMTFSGGNNQTVNLLGKTVEDIVVNKSANTLTFTGSLTTDSFTHQSGGLALNGSSITSSGNFDIQETGNIDATTLSGTSLTIGGDFTYTGASSDLLTLNASGSWTISVTGTGTGNYATVAYSDASGGSQISCSVGCVNAGNNTNWSIPDDTDPTLSTLSPVNSATGVTLSGNLVITFSEIVITAAGAYNDVVIKKYSDNSVVETIDAQSNQITGSGSTSITINPSSDLPEYTQVYVEVGSGAFQDPSGNNYAGFSGNAVWTFTGADVTAPSVPANLTGSAVSSSQINLSWDASTDNVAVLAYKVYRDSSHITTTSSTSYNDTGLTASTQYSYTVLAYDEAGNESAESDAISVTTTQTTVNVTGCGYLDQSNTRYLVQNNLTSTGTCLALIADDITLDLNGYTITYDNASPIVVPNSDFEIETLGNSQTASGWTFTTGANMERSSGTVVLPVTVASGSYAIRVPVTASDQFIYTTDKVTFEPNMTYSLSARFYNKQSSNVDLYVSLSGSSVIARHQGQTNRGFQYTKTNFTTNASGASHRIIVGMSGAGLASGSYVYIDDVRVQKTQSQGIAIGPRVDQSSLYPDLNQFGNASNAIVTNGTIQQGQAKGDEADGIRLAANSNNVQIYNVTVNVYGANSKNVVLAGFNQKLYDSTLNNDVTVIESRDSFDGAVVDVINGYGFHIYNNTMEGGAQNGIVGANTSNTTGALIYNNTIALKSRYTNGFAFQLYASKNTKVYNNTVNCHTGDYACRGLFFGGSGFNNEAYGNTIRVQELPRIQEYNGCQGGDFVGAYGIQVEIAWDISIHNNTVHAYANQCDANAFRPNPSPVTGTGIHVFDNVFVATASGSSLNSVSVKIDDVVLSGAVTIRDNELVTNSRWVYTDGVSNLQFLRNTFSTSGSLASPFDPLYAFDWDPPNGAALGLRFIDNIYPNSTVEDLFEAESFVCLNGTHACSLGGGDNTSTHSYFFYDWNLNYTVKNDDDELLENARIEISNASGASVFDGLSSATGTGSARLTEFRNNSGTLVQYNPYTVTATYSGDTVSTTKTMTGTTPLTLIITASGSGSSGGGGGGGGGGSSGGSSDSGSSSSDNGSSRGGSRGGSGGAGILNRIQNAFDSLFGDSDDTTSDDEQPIQRMEVSTFERRGLLSAIFTGKVVIYKDVAFDTWFAQYIATLIENSIANGYTDQEGNLLGEFGVTDPVTYAEILKMAFRAIGISPSEEREVANASAKRTWASSYVRLAEERNIQTITSKTDVHSPATRAELISTILQISGLPEKEGNTQVFTDLPTSHTYWDDIQQAVRYGLIQGDTSRHGVPLGTVRPNDTMNRAEAAKLIAFLLQLRGQ